MYSIMWKYIKNQLQLKQTAKLACLDLLVLSSLKASLKIICFLEIIGLTSPYFILFLLKFWLLNDIFYFNLDNNSLKNIIIEYVGLKEDIEVSI